MVCFRHMREQRLAKPGSRSTRLSTLKRSSPHPRGHPTIHLSKSISLFIAKTCGLLDECLHDDCSSRGGGIIALLTSLSTGVATIFLRHSMTRSQPCEMLQRPLPMENLAGAKRLLVADLFATGGLIRFLPQFKHRSRMKPKVGEPTGSDYAVRQFARQVYSFFGNDH